MSQSDYIKRKQVANILRTDAAENPIYNSSMYVKFKQFQLENEITSDSIDYSNIADTNNQVIFNMERNVTNCPSFLLCSGTSARPNRVAHKGRLCNNYPLNWYQRKVAESTKKLWCKCQLNRSTTDGNACSCFIGK